MKSTKINIADYSYNLPDGKIAKYPAERRDTSKLLVYKDQSIEETAFNHIVEVIPSDSIIVCNNTRVIHARLQFFKKTGARIEIFCLTPQEPQEYNLIFEATKEVSWSCMVGNLKKWKDEDLELTFTIEGKDHRLHASKSGLDNTGKSIIRFSWQSGHSFAEVLNACGTIPIPPYLNRESEEVDSNRYQTVYSQHDGSVAAPTAGLHFTPDIFNALQENGIGIKEVTLHVGAGTFQPVKVDNAREHKMHGEQIIVDKQFLQDVISEERKIFATGTTSMRTLESLYWLGVKVSKGEEPTHILQWDWEKYQSNLSLKESFRNLVDHLEKTGQEYVSAITEIMIVPGYQFKVVDALITNFHQPNSTLLLLIASFIGDDWKKVYNYALNNDFRFLSYGDSSVLFRCSVV